MGYMYNLNVGCGDSTVIQTPTATFLVDCHDIDRHTNLLPQGKLLRGVFITHQHHDHYSGLRYLRENRYTIEYLFFSPYNRQQGDPSISIEEWNEFNDHRAYFQAMGTKVYQPYRQASFEKPYWGPDGLRFWILGPAKAIATDEAREIHDACLVFKVDMGTRKCLFTGDASDVNLAYIANNTTHCCDDILHASHHGSINGAEESFIQKCNADYTVISTKPGVHENVPHPDALAMYARHTKKRIYRTDIDGTLTWSF
jgi:beta-lactamase superfamily II metal-dependent hydrolase